MTSSFASVAVIETSLVVVGSKLSIPVGLPPVQVNVLESAEPAVLQVIWLDSPTFSRVSSTVWDIHSVGSFKPQEIFSDPVDVSPEKTAPLVSSSGISQFKA